MPRKPSKSWGIGWNPVKPRESIRDLRDRTAVPNKQFEALNSKAKRRAFSVAKVAHLDVLQAFLDSLKKAATEGRSLSDWLEEDAPKAGLEDAHMENVFRTNLQSAYTAGMHERHVANADDRPYWLFDAIVDDRTTNDCSSADGIVLHNSDAWWQRNYPPRHYQCRSSVQSLTEDEALEHGITQSPPNVVAMSGFGSRPDSPSCPVTDDWQPDAAKYDPRLLKLTAKIGAK